MMSDRFFFLFHRGLLRRFGLGVKWTRKRMHGAPTVYINEAAEPLDFKSRSKYTIVYFNKHKNVTTFECLSESKNSPPQRLNLQDGA